MNKANALAVGITNNTIVKKFGAAESKGFKVTQSNHCTDVDITNLL